MAGPLCRRCKGWLQAHARFCEGYLPGMYFQRGRCGCTALAAFVRYYLERDDGVNWVRQVIQGRFNNTEDADRIRGAMLRLLETNGVGLKEEITTRERGKRREWRETGGHHAERGDYFVDRAGAIVRRCQTMAGRMEFAEPFATASGERRQLNPAEVPDSVWKGIAGRLRAKWEAIDGKSADPKTRGSDWNWATCW